MVRVKKRYLVVQFDRVQDLQDQHRKLSGIGEPLSALDDARSSSSSGVMAALRGRIQELHGDFGMAAAGTGLRVVYANPDTKVVLVQCRHGPHRLVASSLPMITKIREERVVPRVVYTGATIRNCYKFLDAFQRRQLHDLLSKLSGDKDVAAREVLQKKLDELQPPKIQQYHD